jgi:hypothetical protein
MIAIGMDVGQAADYSALVFIRRVSPSSASGAHVIDNIVRYPLGMPYPDLVANVVQRHLTNKHQFAIDNTGVGRAVAD